MKKTATTAILLLGLLVNAARSQNPSGAFSRFVETFADEYRALDIPWVDFDYQEYLRQIPSLREIEKREEWLRQYREQLAGFDTSAFSPAEYRTFRHLRYQLDLHLERCLLEKKFKSRGPAAIPADGLSRLPGGAEWYRFYIRYATGVAISPDEIFEYGMAELKKVRQQMHLIQLKEGFVMDTAAWWKTLNEDRFFLTERDSVTAGYERIQTRVLAHLDSLFEQAPDSVPDIGFMTWPNAGPYTPPGIYLSEDDNAYGKAVFQFNFYGNRHNRRAMDWLFLHEAIPGHHFHRYVRQQAPRDPLDGLWFAGGTVEGWATYVEYFGEAMGLYQGNWERLGKWEWDLVRSARIVLSVGIHDRGWTKAGALAFWKANVPNQDAIAEREVTRCINWPAQVLTYKIGAKKIMEMRRAAEERMGETFDVRRFHSWFLSAGYVPLAVLEG